MMHERYADDFFTWINKFEQLIETPGAGPSTSTNSNNANKDGSLSCSMKDMLMTNKDRSQHVLLCKDT